MSETVDLPWLDEPVELAEAIELIAQADEDDEQTIQEARQRVERLERRVAALEDTNSLECPSCADDDRVFKAGVGAAKLASNGSLSEKNVTALNSESHVCLECGMSFTPHLE